MYKIKRGNLAETYGREKEIRSFLESVFSKNYRKEIHRQEDFIRSIMKEVC